MIQFDQISYYDFPKICRICLKHGDHKNVFSSRLILLFNIITNLKTEEDDKLPKNVCDHCTSTLQKLDEFMTMCKDNYTTLINIATREKEENVCEQIHDNNVNEIKTVLSSVSPEAQNTFQNDKKERYESKDETNIKLRKENSHDRQLQTESDNVRSCRYCDESFHTLRHLEGHMLTPSDTKPFKCNICPIHFSRKSSLISHQIIHSAVNRKSDSFDGCDSSQYLLEKSNEHDIIVTAKNFKGRKKWHCIYCDKFFSKKDDLQRHLRIHTGFRPFQCKYCEKNFTQNSTLIRHIHSKHADRETYQTNFECYVCEKKFVRKDHLEQHVINLHVKKQTFVSDTVEKGGSCDKCGKSFSLIAYLEQHIERVHRPENTKIKSRIKKVDDKSLMSSVPKLCSICGKLFQKGKAYHAHMSRCHSLREKKIKNHTEKPKPKDKYQCWHCGKIVNSHCNLSVHLRVHTGEKPYQCKFCPKRFSVWTCRQEHENIHTGFKPFQCESCDKAFKQRSALLKHLRSAIHKIQSKT